MGLRQNLVGHRYANEHCIILPGFSRIFQSLKVKQMDKSDAFIFLFHFLPKSSKWLPPLVSHSYIKPDLHTQAAAWRFCDWASSIRTKVLSQHYIDLEWLTLISCGVTPLRVVGKRPSAWRTSGTDLRIPGPYCWWITFVCAASILTWLGGGGTCAKFIIIHTSDASTTGRQDDEEFLNKDCPRGRHPVFSNIHMKSQPGERRYTCMSASSVEQ